MQFDYFYGNEAEQFTFYRIPKVLIIAPEFKKVSDSAKLLYGLMLDRMGLSIKNGWVDEYNRAYIFFTVDDIMEYMSCATAKATKLMKELDSKHGIGLVERVKQGQGKPAKIYLKKFISKSENQDFQKPKAQTFEKRKSRVSENESADFQQTKCNYNNSNNTDFSNINPINQDISEIKDRWIEEKQKTVSEIKGQIDYDALVNSYDAGVVDNIVGIMTEVMLSANDRKFRIGSVDMPAYKVKEQYSLITFAHLEILLLDYKDIKHRIHAGFPYMVAALYNLPLTADISITNRVNRDMRGG